MSREIILAVIWIVTIGMVWFSGYAVCRLLHPPSNKEDSE